MWVKPKPYSCDARLVEGLTGETNIYKRRREQPPEPFAFQALPKRMTFLFDLSASMSRYSHDGRLQRSLEAAVMVMESFANFPAKVHYEIRGHSGDTENLSLSTPGEQYDDECDECDECDLACDECDECDENGIACDGCDAVWCGAVWCGVMSDVLGARGKHG